MTIDYDGTPNEDRADYGETAILAAGLETNVILSDDIGTAVYDVLAYIAHFIDRIGEAPEDVFAAALRSYYGDHEDGPPAEYDHARFPDRAGTFDPGLWQ